MPLFEYLCESCGRKMEVIQSVGEKPPAICDRCGGPLRKLLSAPSFQFKGTGWYVSDYGRSGSPAPPANDAPAADAGSPEGSAPKGTSNEVPKADAPKKAPKKGSKGDS
jgi:putative FmdB family regulatory protein